MAGASAASGRARQAQRAERWAQRGSWDSQSKWGGLTFEELTTTLPSSYTPAGLVLRPRAAGLQSGCPARPPRSRAHRRARLPALAQPLDHLLQLASLRRHVKLQGQRRKCGEAAHWPMSRCLGRHSAVLARRGEGCGCAGSPEGTTNVPQKSARSCSPSSSPRRPASGQPAPPT